LAVLTLLISVHYHGYDVGAPELRSEELLKDFPGSAGFAIPPAIDTLRPAVIFNDTELETTSQIANYYLTGADHRHLVYDHRDFAPANPAAFVACLRALGAGYVYLGLETVALRRHVDEVEEEAVRAAGERAAARVHVRQDEAVGRGQLPEDAV